MKVFSNLVSWFKGFSFNFFNKRKDVIVKTASVSADVVDTIATVVVTNAVEKALDKTVILTQEEKKEIVDQVEKTIDDIKDTVVK